MRHLHIYLTLFSVTSKSGSLALQGKTSAWIFLYVAALLRAASNEVKGRKRLTWNDVIHIGGFDQDEGETCPVGRGADSSASSVVTGGLSNGGSGGTGSSAGRKMSIPWCSGAEMTLGHCFGNPGGGQNAEGKVEKVVRKHRGEILLQNMQPELCMCRYILG